jgi:hypothetical protein
MLKPRDLQLGDCVANLVLLERVGETGVCPREWQIEVRGGNHELSRVSPRSPSELEF